MVQLKNISEHRPKGLIIDVAEDEVERALDNVRQMLFEQREKVGLDRLSKSDKIDPELFQRGEQPFEDRFADNGPDLFQDLEELLEWGKDFLDSIAELIE